MPKDTEGVNIVRPLAVFGEEHDHAEIVFDNVRVPKSPSQHVHERFFAFFGGEISSGAEQHLRVT